ncbi:MAG TPA: Fic family protein [Planococcus sp. (in: firmicutes)]|nr:Fic family protein [Planococcus sp. (in: firmicutes)]
MSKYQHSSKYCYPDSEVLVNLLDVKEEEKLKELETVYTLYRLSELSIRKPADPVDVKAFLEIHRYILQDIYPFAGELRREMISKGTSSFAHPDFIETHLTHIFAELAKENYLKGMQREELIPRLAYFLAELNALHPFREGNGRTIREFARQLTQNAGYRLDWEKVLQPAEIINAFVDSFHSDNRRLEKILDEILSK